MPFTATTEPSRRRVLLVGLSPLALAAVEPALCAVSEVSSVSFPGDDFDVAVESFCPDVVIVDVTYLAVNVVRPLILTRFSGSDASIVFMSDAGTGWLDELRTLTSRPLGAVGIGTLVDLVRAGQPVVRS